MITLPEQMDISSVTGVKSRLEKALEIDTSTIEISAQNVEIIDSAVFQLLLSFQQQVISDGKEVRFLKVSENMIGGSNCLV